MFKRMFLTLVLIVALAAPAVAETSGVYAGLKFLDSIQSTGKFSKSGDFDSLDMDNYTQNTVGGGIFAGYDFYPQYQVPVRTELEYAIRSNMTKTWDKNINLLGTDVKASTKGEWNIQTLFMNAYWDFHNSTAFTPYVGAGAGLGFIKSKYKSELSANGNSDSDSVTQYDTVFAWNAGAGCSYAFTEHFSADLAYRFVGLGYTEINKKVDGEKNSIGTAPYVNEFSLGLRYSF
ncbi:MAG: outer membrane beta-barrel protein [Desulfovibrio sp.]